LTSDEKPASPSSLRGDVDESDDDAGDAGCSGECKVASEEGFDGAVAGATVAPWPFVPALFVADAL
jgi:hypothetical protein